MKFSVTFVILLSLIGSAVPMWAQTTDGTRPQQERLRTPSEQLEREHRVTMRVVNAAKKEAAAIRKQETPDTKRVRQMVDFFENFVDDCHHAKEEHFYFPAVVYHDSTEVEALVRELKTEHVYARSVISELKYVLDYDEKNVDFLAERLETYAALIKHHIEKENDRLFPKADIYIKGAEERAILTGFEKIETVDLGPGFHEKYHALAEELATSPDDSE